MKKIENHLVDPGEFLDNALAQTKKEKESPQEIRENSFPDETEQIGVDFDGVIHKNSKGFFDGSVYDEPVDNIETLLKELSSKYKLVLFSAKARKDRMLINGKTGEELIHDWLVEKNLRHYFIEITSEKPRAVCYIDDKAVYFEAVDTCISLLRERGIL